MYELRKILHCTN